MSTDPLQVAYDKGQFVRIELEEEGHEGFVVGLTQAFVLLQAIHDWNDIGAHIFPRETIQECDVSEFHDDQLKVLDFNSVKRTKRYNGINLSGYDALFKSLKARGKYVVVAFADGNDVGEIVEVGKDSFDLKAIDPGGNALEDTLECPYEEIVSIQFDDNYSRVLQRYAERAAPSVS